MITGVTIISEALVIASTVPIVCGILWGICAILNMIVAGMQISNENIVGYLYIFLAILDIFLCCSYFSHTEKVAEYTINISPETSIVEFNNTYEIREQIDEDTFVVRLKNENN